MSRALWVLLSLGCLMGCAMEANSEDRSTDASEPGAEERETSQEGATLGGAWMLASFADQRAQVAVGEEATMEFEIEGATASGFAGCNRYGASFEASGSTLSFGMVRRTMMACPDEPRTRQEEAFLMAMEAVRGFAIAGDELQLLDGSGALLMTLVPRPDLDLADSDWMATGINNGRQAVVSVLPGAVPTATFAEGTVSGSAGCNTYQAPFSAGEGVIEIGPVAATRMTCSEPDGVMEQEGWFLAALETAATYRVEQDRLELRTAGGALAISFGASEMDP